MPSNITGFKRDLVLSFLSSAKPALHIRLPSDDSNYSSNLESLSYSVDSENKIIFSSAVLNKDCKGREVEVFFYFNGVPLFFVSEIECANSNFIVKIPQELSTKTHFSSPEKKFVHAILYLISRDREDAVIACAEKSEIPLFSSSRRDAAKSYFSLSSAADFDSAEMHKRQLDILYIDERGILLGTSSDSLKLQSGVDYAMTLSFPLRDDSPVQRRIALNCIFAKRVVSKKNEKKCCLLLNFTSIEAEDKRFLYESANSGRFFGCSESA